MSKLIKEDANFLYLRDWLHGKSESFSDWMLDENKNPTKYSQKILEAEHYALYEISVDYKIHKQTGEITYLHFGT